MAEPLETEKLLRYELDAGEGLKVKVASDPLNSWGYALGHSLWTAAPELIDFLGQVLPAGALRERRVLELGAGLGAVGIALGLRGAMVTLTDLPACVELLRYNAGLNFTPDQLKGPEAQVSVQQLIWGDADLPRPPQGQAGWDYVIASDVCYDGDCFPALLETIVRLAVLNPDTKVILSLPDRTETRTFFPLVAAAGFAWRFLRRVRRADLVHAIHIYQLVQQARMLPATPAAITASPLVVWDFDWTMVEENSDTWVVERLDAKPAFLRLQQEESGWTSLMDAAMGAAATECGADEAAMRTAPRTVPISPDVIQTIRALTAAGGIEQVIVSDANSVFIQELLAAHSLQGCFSEVHTNPAAFEDGVLRVRPYHAAAHGCEACPDNMCKGQIMERLLVARQFRNVVYLGDGRGDFCPCTRLGPTDAILARQTYPDGRPASLLQLLVGEAAVIRAADGASLPPPPARASAAATSAAAPVASNGSVGSRRAVNTSSAVWAGGNTCSEGHTATLVRQLAADAARILNSAGDAAAPRPALKPYLASSDRDISGTAESRRQAKAATAAAAVRQQAGDAAEDAVAQRRDHEVPDPESDNETMNDSQVVDPARASSWPPGDVAAPVQVWNTPSECARLLRGVVESWGTVLS